MANASAHEQLAKTLDPSAGKLAEVRLVEQHAGSPPATLMEEPLLIVIGLVVLVLVVIVLTALGVNDRRS